MKLGDYCAFGFFAFKASRVITCDIPVANGSNKTDLTSGTPESMKSSETHLENLEKAFQKVDHSA